MKDQHHSEAAERLADWRAAGRDTAAAEAASEVANLALEAAKAADEAASETEAAASAAASAVDQALKAAASAKRAAAHAANAARILLASAEGDRYERTTISKWRRRLRTERARSSTIRNFKAFQERKVGR